MAAMHEKPGDGPPRPPGEPDRSDLAAQLVRHLDALRCFVRIQLSPALRQREQESDIVQSVCADVLAHPERFEWRGEVAFRSWLYRAVLDCVRHKLRFHQADKRDVRREHAAESSDQRLVDSYADFVTPSRIAMSGEMQLVIERAIDGLSEGQREVFVRARLLHMDHDAIAAELGISAENSRQLLHRALAQMALAVHRSR
ncbi:MAG: sigma-70 family RNA polymerase sigma factor [Planctomycetes bacterium]|nr:sigma-70 family RNA polymerase sigma factor [Planctomycetota bacterium]